MKIDLHCHTKAGSFDAKVELKDYIDKLKSCGFGGMMITDHSSYKGCKVWDHLKNRDEYKDFTVIKAVEYDTRDGGHILVILPDGVLLSLLSIRGLSLKYLIKLVHSLGGILGPAHPFGTKSSSFMHMKAAKKTPQLMKEFDFIEVFNTCESAEANRKARSLAELLGKPGLGGSDAHKLDYVGMGYTEFENPIHCNQDLISAIKANEILAAGGIERASTLAMALKMHWAGVWSFKLYNRGLGYLFTPLRHRAAKASC